MAKRIKLSEFAGELDNFTKKSSRKLQDDVKKGVIRSIPQLVAKSPVDTGEYANSWDFTEGEKKVILGNFSPHAPIIEFGARPFTPPIGPLLAWAKRVLGDPSQPPDYSSDVWRLAKGVQNKISINGMKPKHILELMIPIIIENIKREIG